MWTVLTRAAAAQVSLLHTSHGSKYTDNTYWGRKTWCRENVALAHSFNKKKRVEQEAQIQPFRPAVLRKAQLPGEVVFGHPKQRGSCHPRVVATELAPAPRAESQQVPTGIEEHLWGCNSKKDGFCSWHCKSPLETHNRTPSRWEGKQGDQGGENK